MTTPTNVTFSAGVAPAISAAWLNGTNDWVYGWYGIIGETFTAVALRNKLNVKTVAVEADSDHTTTTGNILGGILSTTFNTVSRTITLPTAAALVAATSNVAVGTCLEFDVYSYGTTGCVLANGTGITTVSGGTGLTISTSPSVSRFNLLFTNVSGGTEAILFTKISQTAN